MSNYPPGVTGSEPQIAGHVEWERWAETVKPGDRCEAWAREALVKSVEEDGLRVILDGEGHWCPWEDCGPLTVATSLSSLPSWESAAADWYRRAP